MTAATIRATLLSFVLLHGWCSFGQTSRETQQVAAPAGGSAQFSVTADGTEPFAYQWRKNGVAVAGATLETLTLTGLQPIGSGTYDVRVSNSQGSVLSNNAVVLTVELRPIITTQPSGRSVALGGAATFNVVATGSPDNPVTYQWRRNGVNLSGATAATLTLTSVTDRDFASYSVLVTSSWGSRVSLPALLTRSGATATAPVINRQPTTVTIGAGSTLVLSTAASGTPEPSFQWRRDGMDLVGATASTLVVENAPGGAYTVVASNPGRTVTSTVAAVTLGTGFGRLVNVSARGFVGTGANILITGFVISGAASKQLLIRLVGPTLTRFGVTGELTDPALDLLNAGGQSLQTNDNWDSIMPSAALVRSSATAAGAFPLVEASRDAALVATLNPGAYTIKSTGVGSTTGIAIAEVYDLDAANLAGSRLVNLSTRDFVGAGSDILISGFVVDGTLARTVLVRAVGPTLRDFGVAGVLAQPELRIFDTANRLVASNQGWESVEVSDAVMATSARVGAFALPRGSADCAVLATLAPGAYTAQVVGADGGTGVALLEVYEVP